MDGNTETKDELRRHQIDLTVLQGSRQLPEQPTPVSISRIVCISAIPPSLHLKNLQILNENGVDVSFALILVAIEVKYGR